MIHVSNSNCQPHCFMLSVFNEAVVCIIISLLRTQERRYYLLHLRNNILKTCFLGVVYCYCLILYYRAERLVLYLIVHDIMPQSTQVGGRRPKNSPSLKYVHVHKLGTENVYMWKEIIIRNNLSKTRNLIMRLISEKNVSRFSTYYFIVIKQWNLCYIIKSGNAIIYYIPILSQV